MDIVLSWDPSVSSLPPGQQAAFEGAVTWAADYWDRTLTNSLTIDISVGWGEITQDGQTSGVSAGTAEGGPNDGQDYAYSQVAAALRAHETSPGTTSAYGALPVRDPSNGLGVFVPVLEAQALGLPTDNGGVAGAGAVGFGAPAPGSPYNFSTTNRAVAGEADFIGIALHEISHALGRFSTAGSSPAPTAQDLFRFTGPGVEDPASGAGAYFSLNDGATALQYWAGADTDPGDWSADGPIPGNDAFTEIYGTGVVDRVTSTDLSLMNVLGFSITPSTPRDDFKGNEISDALIENTSGAVAVGEAAPGGTLAYATVAGLGPEWSFVAAGRFLIDGRTDFLIENTGGVLVVGEVGPTGGTGYSAVGSVGPEWRFVGSGDFLGAGADQFLMENTAGAVVASEVGGASQARYTQIASLGPEWTFVGTGDFLGNGRIGFLIENTAGAVDLGEVGANQLAAYTQVAALDPRWRFVEAGDFMGDGKTDFLIETSSGTLLAGEVGSGGATSYAQLGGLGPEWRFVGAGDYSGSGIDSFLIESTAGAVVLGTVANGQAAYVQIGQLGAEWSFHG